MYRVDSDVFSHCTKYDCNQLEMYSLLHAVQRRIEIWIGLNRAVDRGRFRWLDQERTEFDESSGLSWAEGHPRNNFNCAMVVKNPRSDVYEVYSIRCSKIVHYCVCEAESRKYRIRTDRRNQSAITSSLRSCLPPPCLPCHMEECSG